MKNFSFSYSFFKKQGLIIFFLSVMLLPSLLLAAKKPTPLHGYVEMPLARQLFCYQDGGFWSNPDGSNIPNKACREAYLKSGTYQFIDNNAYTALVPNYTSMAAVKKAIPNGTLCAAGDPKKSGMNIVSPDWQRTTLKAGSTITFSFKATATHNPSYWEIYITKKGFDPKKSVLRWEDLELLAKQGDIQPSGSYYRFNITLPANRKGDAILYTRWQRVDPSGEGFYNCSDITLE